MTDFRKFLLTFDVEDFINPNAICALHIILEILEKHKLRAIFFITGYMAEKISNFPETIDMLMNHEIGYHSSSHSVRPIIPEYTDLESYKEAYEISLQRETSHIDPLTGKPEREGGIYLLQDQFHPKKIQAFRAPGMCWTPPHLEALNSLGIRYDFSSTLTFSEPVFYKGITFYPYTTTQHWNGTTCDYECLVFSILRHKITVFDLHPTLLVNKVAWDSIYYKGNPKSLQKVPKRVTQETALLFSRFGLLIRQISLFGRLGLLETDPTLNISSKVITLDNNNKMQECYETSNAWSIKFFDYRPKFTNSHFLEFFKEVC